MVLAIAVSESDKRELLYFLILLFQVYEGVQLAEA